MLNRTYIIDVFYYVEFFTTNLLNKGIEPEIADLLQGRISDSML